MMTRLFLNAKTRRRGDAEKKLRTPDTKRFASRLHINHLFPCAPASLRLCVKNRLRAFTLIETALAMLAIGLGLLAIFGLGRLGLQASKETDHDQRCAIMADAVFETLREYNARFVDEARTNGVPDTWGNLWEDVALNKIQIIFPEIAYMSEKVQVLHFWQKDENDLYEKGQYPPTPAFQSDNISLSEWNPRYILYVSDADTSPVAQAINVLQFTLMIFPDGDTYSSEYRIFHTTLSNPGGLP